MAARRNVSVCLMLGRLTLGSAVEFAPYNVISTSYPEAERIRRATGFGRRPYYMVRTS